MKYDFTTWEEGGVWTSHAPAIPGVYGVGKTADEAEEDLEEATGFLFEYLDEIGEEHPKPSKFRVGRMSA